MIEFAPRHTTGDLTSDLVIIASAQSAAIRGFILSNTGVGVRTVTMQTSEGTPATITTYELAARETFVMDIPFLVDTGLQFASVSSEVEVVVFHSNIGA